MKVIKYTILYCVLVRTFVVPFYYGSGTIISYGYSSGSDFLTSYGSGSGSTAKSYGSGTGSGSTTLTSTAQTSVCGRCNSRGTSMLSSNDSVEEYSLL
jgi:hypothetical protein